MPFHAQSAILNTSVLTTNPRDDPAILEICNQLVHNGENAVSEGSGYNIHGIASFEIFFMRKGRHVPCKIRKKMAGGTFTIPDDTPGKSHLLNINSEYNNCILLSIISHFALNEDSVKPSRLLKKSENQLLELAPKYFNYSDNQSIPKYDDFENFEEHADAIEKFTKTSLSVFRLFKTGEKLQNGKPAFKIETLYISCKNVDPSRHVKLLQIEDNAHAILIRDLPCFITALIKNNVSYIDWPTTAAMRSVQNIFSPEKNSIKLNILQHFARCKYPGDFKQYRSGFKSRELMNPKTYLKYEKRLADEENLKFPKFNRPMTLKDCDAIEESTNTSIYLYHLESLKPDMITDETMIKTRQYVIRPIRMGKNKKAETDKK